LEFEVINFSLQSSELVKTFDNAKHQYKPWVFWYCIHGNVSPKGIHADLKAMSEAGLGGVLQEDLG
jgi:hypothetical protein